MPNQSKSVLIQCEVGKLPEILKFYQLVASETKDMPRFGRWIYGLHPTASMIEDYVQKGMMYYLKDGKDIVAAVAVSPCQSDEYHGVDWKMELEDDAVAVVHLLAVHPRYQNQGYAGTIMREVIELVRQNGKKAIRLDALECNIPAHRLYESLGFIKRDIRYWYASNTGWINFYLFELFL